MTVTERIITIPIEDEMKEAYLDYAMSVIVQRALPDVRDGLKPVHRRILYSMHNIGLTPDKPHKKSATIVGDTIGKYHPHGDVAVYDSLVRMAQDFNMRYQLIDGHGNFGSVDGDPAAAYRYTEARLRKISMELIEELDKDTVDYRPNFDNSLNEPVVFPAKYPNLLVNGSSGIAVGMATNIPPHNLGEVIDGLIFLIDNPDTSSNDLMKIILAPDFPTGGFIVGVDGVRQAYSTGRGSVVMRSKTHTEDIGKTRKAIIVTEIPYQVNKARLIEQIADLVKDKRVKGISDIRDESDRKGMRIVIELQANAKHTVILNTLYKHSQLQCNFGIIMLALVDGVPKLLSIGEVLSLYLEHRKVVIIRRTNFELEKARSRAHILEGLQIALDNIDNVIATIRSCPDAETARAELIKKFSLSEKQAVAILEMRLQRLTGLERGKIKAEYTELLKIIATLEELLSSERNILEKIKEELGEIRNKFADKRRTQILPGEHEGFEMEDLIPVEKIVVSITCSGYIKRMPLTTYKSQHRGGRGILGHTTKEEDILEDIFITTTHHHILFFTNKAKVYRLKGYELPEAGRHAKGNAIVNLLQVEGEEKITAIIPIADFESDKYLFMATKKGIFNKTRLGAYSNIRKNGLLALILSDDDELVSARLTTGDDELVIITHKGMSIKFHEKDVRPTGRMTRGVIGIRIKKDDHIVTLTRVRDGDKLLVITENGFGKCSLMSHYTPHHRGGKGMKTLKVTERVGSIVGARAVTSDDELLILSKDGIIIRLKMQNIPVIGRSTQGVTLMRLGENDKVTSIAIIRKEDVVEEEAEETAITNNETEEEEKAEEENS